MRVSVVVVVAASALCACASEQVRWGDETAAVSTTAPAAPDETAEKPKTAAEYAAKFPTDSSCEAEVRRLDEKNRDLALKLLNACIDRGDFKRLAALVDAPWTPALRTLPAAVGWCARVVAARAGDVDADVKACAGAGVAIKTLEQVLTDPNHAKGSVVVFRGRLDPERTSKKTTALIETVVEEGEVDTTATGRRVLARFGAHKLPARDAIVVGKVTRLADAGDDEDSEGEPVAVVDVQGSFAAAAAPTYN